MMLANGTITQQMHDAGGYFRALFRSPALDGMSKSVLLRLPGQMADTLSDHHMDARLCTPEDRGGPGCPRRP